MQTIRVVETADGWQVRCGDEVLLQDVAEEPCFTFALATSSRMFDAGRRYEVVLQRLDSLIVPAD
ncbi:hypothetical protein [Caulobacter endophyticus]|uniref:Uncharacterized protein n=1 Tax=Caulobacter endophyticus TaxID=2172652 RepID=A0A2T9JXS6_9CAUL|nr:hypothetical protein [Caulobacter endophyticus]PVM88515.1 hypothetical protein DDF67_13265 [Caulobacter endophyticus]